MKNKRILICVNNLGVGGAERLVVDDINEMLRLGLEVRLITFKVEKTNSLASELHLKKDYWIEIPFLNFFDIKSWFRLWKEIRSYNPDLVVTHLWFANVLGRIAAYFTRVPSIITFEQNVYDTLKTRKMFLVDKLLQFFSTKIIAVSGAVKESLMRHGIHEKRIDILYNSVDVSKFEKKLEKKILRNDLKIPPEAFVYIFVGRLIHQKGIDVLIEAFSIVNSAYLVIVGEGIEKENLLKKVKCLHLEDKVFFTGVRNDIPHLLNSADCFVLPSRYEGSPLVLTEALAAGMPIVVSDFGAAQEIITHEKDGLIVPRENVDLLGRALQRIKEEHELRNKLILYAKRRAQDFSISSHVRAILRYINI